MHYDFIKNIEQHKNNTFNNTLTSFNNTSQYHCILFEQMQPW